MLKIHAVCKIDEREGGGGSTRLPGQCKNNSVHTHNGKGNKLHDEQYQE